ncbi:lysine--tRNA ligase [candidate division WOR-3 bacterium]|uniref:Lysine--tRNA ligase n=1 Tax=candidate division WOR-3 bacterium TaxID=2052148 RepID=A0A660SGJ4_UNCW3|nr:MAG: lysine--tRNA ligase [candidate division WOR-3 bacterium]
MSEYRNYRLENLKRLKLGGVDPYPYRYERTHTCRKVKETFPQSDPVSVAGRITAIRRHGRTVFLDIIDATGKIQIYLKKDALGDRFDLLEYFDIGDIIGIKGKPFRTRSGEITINADAFTLLSKSLQPLPEKYHGLRDIETRYRKRYLDLITNEKSRRIFRRRSEIIHEIRKFLDHRGFMEVETPILQPIYGGAAAIPFETYYRSLGSKMYLRIADELYLKRLIVGGYEKVYEIGKDFRNEGIDRLHNPEFTQIEIYEAYKDYKDMMDLTEELLEHLVTQLYQSVTIEYQKQSISFKRPFKRIRFMDALKEKINYNPINASLPQLRETAKWRGIELKEPTSRGRLIDKLFSELVQKEIVDPTFVIDYPKIISPLAKTHRENPDLAERFELIICGIEIANAFSELNDPIEQRKRFVEQLEAKEEGIGEIDEDFLYALEVGMPPTGGLGIGIDRLVMILLNQSSLRDVILFPQLKRLELKEDV